MRLSLTRWCWSLLVLVGGWLLAACATPTAAPSDEAPTADSALAVNATPSPLSLATAEPGMVASPTGEATATAAPTVAASATPAPPAATPVARDLAGLEPIASAARISVVDWSPDGRYLLYRTHTADDVAANPQFPAGDFFVADTEQGICPVQVVDFRQQQRAHFWLSDHELAYVTDQGRLVVWPVCSDERADYTDLFPELPDGALAVNAERTQFLLSGRTSFWLWSRASGTVRAVADLRSENGWNVSGAPSPSGETIALSLSQGDGGSAATILINVETAEVVQTIPWTDNGGKGTPAAPTWLSDTQFFINAWSQGPLLVTVGGETVELAAQIVGDQPLDGIQGYNAAITPLDNGHYHLLLLSTDKDYVSVGPARLYHSETGETEEITVAPSTFPNFSPDGRWVLFEPPNLSPEGQPTTGSAGIWGRAVDPAGSAAQLVVPAAYGSLFNPSPDGTKTLVYSESGFTILSLPHGVPLQQWSIPSGSRLYPGWSPDGTRLLLYVMTDGAAEQLFVVPVEP